MGPAVKGGEVYNWGHINLYRMLLSFYKHYIVQSGLKTDIDFKQFDGFIERRRK